MENYQEQGEQKRLTKTSQWTSYDHKIWSSNSVVTCWRGGKFIPLEVRLHLDLAAKENKNKNKTYSPSVYMYNITRCLVPSFAAIVQWEQNKSEGGCKLQSIL